MTPEENERSRYLLYKNGNGKKRIEALRKLLDDINQEMDNPLNNDSYYGKVDCLLDRDGRAGDKLQQNKMKYKKALHH